MNIVCHKINENNEKKYTFVLFYEVDEELLSMLKQIDACLTIISFEDIDWQTYFSPYPFGSFEGKGNETIELVKQYLINNHIKQYYVMGYSLGGLMALYSINKLDGIVGCGSVSGSLWYPKFEEHIKKIINQNVYISLGDREHISKNQIMKVVKEKTELFVSVMKENNDVYYQINEGSHFNQIEQRMILAINYLISK